jgi:6-phosphogluconolactonase
MKLIHIFILIGSLFSALCSQIKSAAPGQFAEISGSPFAAGANPGWIAYSPIVSGNLFLAIPNFGDNTASVYTVNQTTGALTEISGSPFGTGSQPAWLAYSPVASGNLFAATVNYGDNTVSVYEVNQTTGAFTQVSGSPFATGNQPYGLAFSPIVSGNLFAAVTNAADNTVSVYSVNQTTGAFTPIAGSPFATGNSPYNITYSPIASGNLFAALTNFNDNNVTVYSVNQSTGAFTQVPGSPFAAEAGPYGIAMSSIVSGNVFVAVANDSTTAVSVYKLDQSNGSLVPVPGSPFTTSTEPNSVAFSPIAGENLFAAVANFTGVGTKRGMQTEPHRSQPNNLSVYLVDQNTGKFTEVFGSPFPVGTQPDGVAFSPVLGLNLFAAVANYGSNNANIFEVSFCPTSPFIAEKVFCSNTNQLILGRRGQRRVLLQKVGDQVIESTFYFSPNSDTFVGPITEEEFQTMVQESCSC